MSTPGGKGSKQRPIQDRESFNRNWDAIFGKKENKEQEKQQQR